MEITLSTEELRIALSEFLFGNKRRSMTDLEKVKILVLDPEISNLKEGKKIDKFLINTR